MAKDFKSIMEMLEQNIKNEMLNCIKRDFREEFEELILDVLNKKEVLLNNQTGYLLEAELLSKYKTSKTFLYKIMNEHSIERFKSGRFYNYNESDFITACKNYRPKKPAFLKKAA